MLRGPPPCSIRRITSVAPALWSIAPVVVGLALNPQNKVLVETLQAALVKARASGEYQKLLTKYNVAAPTDQEFKAAITP